MLFDVAAELTLSTFLCEVKRGLQITKSVFLLFSY